MSGKTPRSLSLWRVAWSATSAPLILWACGTVGPSSMESPRIPDGSTDVTSEPEPATDSTTSDDGNLTAPDASSASDSTPPSDGTLSKPDAIPMADGSTTEADVSDAEVTPTDALLPNDASTRLDSASMIDTGIGASDASLLGSTCTPSCPSGQKLDRFGDCVSASDPYTGCSTAYADYCNVPNAVATCSPLGLCTVGSCRPGWGDCNGDPRDGCEADLTSTSTCGTCMACPPGQVCGPSGCAASCPFPLTDCNGSCSDLSSSPLHCGSCTINCGRYGRGSATCASGQCGTVQCDVTGMVVHPTTCGANDCIDTNREPQCCGTSCLDCTKLLAPGAVAACTNGVCQVGCPTGWESCGSTCALTSIDPQNCGGCGRVCSAAQACQLGVCVNTSALMVADTVQPAAMVFDNGNVLFVDQNSDSVGAAPLSGGHVVTLATGQATPAGIAGDGTYAYWSSQFGGAILRTLESGGGGSPSILASANKPTEVIVDGTYVYWLDSGSNSIRRAPKTGGASTTVASTGVPFVVIGGTVYVSLTATLASGGGLEFADNSGGCGIGGPITVTAPLAPIDSLACNNPGSANITALGGVSAVFAANSCAAYVGYLNNCGNSVTSGLGVVVQQQRWASAFPVVPGPSAAVVAAADGYVGWSPGVGIYAMRVQ